MRWRLRAPTSRRMRWKRPNFPTSRAATGSTVCRRRWWTKRSRSGRAAGGRVRRTGVGGIYEFTNSQFDKGIRVVRIVAFRRVFRTIAPRMAANSPASAARALASSGGPTCVATRTLSRYVRLARFFQRDPAFGKEIASALAAAGLFQVGAHRRPAAKRPAAQEFAPLHRHREDTCRIRRCDRRTGKTGLGYPVRSGRGSHLVRMTRSRSRFDAEKTTRKSGDLGRGWQQFCNRVSL